MKIYLIAGPPAIGKSTSGSDLIPQNVPIIDHDLAAYQYRKQGFNDYKTLASFSANQKIKDYLFAKNDFALELNLGFESHYDYLKSIISVDRSNEVHLILFFTDDLDMCLDRGALRYKNGGHLVESTIINEMYNNTTSLLKDNLALFTSILLIDVNSAKISQVTSKNVPQWVKDNELQKYVIQEKSNKITDKIKPKFNRKL